jgi:NAD(P)-dependent dehydrogenase (short-subunit alcohol dehydrogenase family)
MDVRNGVRSLVDTALDRAVAPGYTRLGYRLRKLGWSDGDPAPDALRGRTALVTGANRGLGQAIAVGLAELGATILLTVRDKGRGMRARDEIRAAVPGADVRVEVCDMSDLAGIRAFAADLTERISLLDILVHNAGLLPDARSETAEGHELTLATHVLGPVLLTELLVPTLANSADPRVIFMSSGGMYTQKLPVADPEYRGGRYNGTIAYARTKRIQVALTPLLAERYAAQHIRVYCMHPGWADTPGVADALPVFRRLNGPLLRSPEEGADTAVWLAATSPAPPTGRFFHDRRPRPQHYLPFSKETEADRESLWQYCATAVGIDPRSARP